MLKQTAETDVCYYYLSALLEFIHKLNHSPSCHSGLLLIAQTGSKHTVSDSGLIHRWVWKSCICAHSAEELTFNQMHFIPESHHESVRLTTHEKPNTKTRAGEPKDHLPVQHHADLTETNKPNTWRFPSKHRSYCSKTVFTGYREQLKYKSHSFCWKIWSLHGNCCYYSKTVHIIY